MFNGSITALVTPFTQQEEVDFLALEALVDFHLENGTDGLVIAGTTGESASLTREEFSNTLARVVGHVNGRIPVLAGTGSAATARTIEQTARAADLGAAGALVVTPYYLRPTQAGLEAHFQAVADEAELPIVLYNVPSRTSVDLLPATVERLAGHPRIAGIKEAVSDPARFDELRDRCGPDFAVLSGDDHSSLQAMKHGACGVISVAANVAPALMHALCEAALEENWEEAKRLDKRLQPLFDALMIETNPIPVKWALFEMHMIGSRIRLPLTELDESCRRQLRENLTRLGLMT